MERGRVVSEVATAWVGGRVPSSEYFSRARQMARRGASVAVRRRLRPSAAVAGTARPR